MGEFGLRYETDKRHTLPHYCNDVRCMLGMAEREFE